MDTAFYVDIDDPLHRVNVHTGDDEPLDVQVAPGTFFLQVDEDGHWVNWDDPEHGFQAVHLGTGEEISIPLTSPWGKVHGMYPPALLGGLPLVRRAGHDGIWRLKRRGDGYEIIKLARDYSTLVELDGQRAVACSLEGGLYVVGPDGEEVAVLRPPSGRPPGR